MAHDYWNPTGAFGWQMSHVLGHWNDSRLASKVNGMLAAMNRNAAMP